MRTLPETKRQTVEDLISTWRRSLMPAKSERIVARVIRLANLFRDGRSEGEWKAIYDDYARCLRMYPEDVIAEAMDDCARTCRYFPRIAEIVAICEAEIRRRKIELYRLEQITFWKPEPEAPKPEPLTAQDRAEVVSIIERLGRRP